MSGDSKRCPTHDASRRGDCSIRAPRVVLYEGELTRKAPLGVGAEREKLLGLVHDHISELITRIVAYFPQVC